MLVGEKLITAEDFYRMPKPRTGERLELVKGEVVTMSPPGAVHGDKASVVVSALRLFAEQHRLGKVLIETGFRLERNPDTVRAPDVSFISNRRLPADGLPEGFILGAPDLAVEVVSPGDLDWEVQGKVGEYLANGANRVWAIRPRARTVTVHHPDGSARTLNVEATLTSEDASFSVPGFRLSLRDLFA